MLARVFPGGVRSSAAVLSATIAVALTAAGCGDEAEPAREPVRFEPLAVSAENPRYVEFRGKPTILITSAEHYGAVINTEVDIDRYLDALEKRRFNLTRVFSGTYFELPDSISGVEDQNTLAPEGPDLVIPWVRTASGEWDLERWDREYFARLRNFMQAASERGIVVELTLFSQIYSEELWDANPMNAENNLQKVGDVPLEEVYSFDNDGLLAYQDRLVKKLVRELNGFDNLYFEIINEGYFGPVEVREQWEERMAGLIRETEAELPNEHLIARNYDPTSRPKPFEGADIHNFHYLRDPAEARARLEGPIAFDETGNQGTLIEPYRVDGWFFIFSGGAVYNNLDWSFTAERENGSLFPLPEGTPGSGGPDLRRHLSYLLEFINRFDFVEMEPAPSLVSTLEGVNARVLAGEGRLGIYLSREEEGPAGRIGLDVDPGIYEIEWASPQAAEIIETVEVTYDGSEELLIVDLPDWRIDLAADVSKVGDAPGGGENPDLTGSDDG